MGTAREEGTPLASTAREATQLARRRAQQGRRAHRLHAQHVLQRLELVLTRRREGVVRHPPQLEPRLAALRARRRLGQPVRERRVGVFRGVFRGRHVGDEGAAAGGGDNEEVGGCVEGCRVCRDALGALFGFVEDWQALVDGGRRHRQAQLHACHKCVKTCRRQRPEVQVHACNRRQHRQAQPHATGDSVDGSSCMRL